MPIEIQIIVAMTLAVTWIFAFIAIILGISDWLFDRWLERRYRK